MSTSIVKKELCDKYPFKNPEIHEDFIFWLEILKNENVNPVGIKNDSVQDMVPALKETKHTQQLI